MTYLSSYQNSTRMSQNSTLSCQQKGYYSYWYFKRIYRIKLVPFCPLIPKSVQQLLPAILILFLRNNLVYSSFETIATSFETCICFQGIITVGNFHAVSASLLCAGILAYFTFFFSKFHNLDCNPYYPSPSIGVILSLYLRRR